MSQPLELFGHAFRAYSEERSARVQRPVPVQEFWWTWRPLQLAMAGAALVVMVSIPVFRSSRTQVVSQVASTAVSDEALLRQVDLEVSRSVPGPMEPLANLMTTDSEADSTAAIKGQ